MTLQSHGFVDQHHRNIVLDEIHQTAGIAYQTIALFV
jgi:hypothetical protein